MTSLRLHTQILLPGTHNVKTLVSIHSNTRKTYTIVKDKHLAKVVMLKVDENRIVRALYDTLILGNALETLIPTDCTIGITDDRVGVFVMTEKLLRDSPLRVSACIMSGSKYYPIVKVRCSIDSNTRRNYMVKKGQELGHLLVTEFKYIESEEDSDSELF